MNNGVILNGVKDLIHGGFVTYTVLSLTNDSWQVFTADVTIDGEPFHAQIEVRWLPAAGRWFLSLWDHASGELMVNQVPLACSFGLLNDLLYPFRSLRGGRGLGSLFLLRNVDAMTEQDPAADTLDQFNLLFGDLYIENGEAPE